MSQSAVIDSLRSKPPKLSVGILAADAMDYGAGVKLLEQFDVLLHLDVMDGRVWPNITAGAPVLAGLRTNLLKDVHLLIEEPEKHVAAFAKDNPKAVQGFVKALNRAIGDVLANPEMGMDAVMKREPLLKRELEKERLVATLKEEMSHPEIAKIGLGDVDPERLKRSIALVVDANALPRSPAPDEVFDRSFLPARAERPAKL